jgi:hypothetical protein
MTFFIVIYCIHLMRVPVTTDQVRAHPKWNGIYTLQGMCKLKASSMCSWRRYDTEEHMEVYFAYADVVSQRGKQYQLQGSVYHLEHYFDQVYVNITYQVINMKYNFTTNELQIETHEKCLEEYTCLFGSFSKVEIL